MNVTDHLSQEPISPTKETDSMNIISKRMPFVCEEVQGFVFLPSSGNLPLTFLHLYE